MEQEQLFENRHLMQVKEIVQNQLDLSEKEANQKKETVVQAQDDLHHETSSSISSNLWNADNFEQLVELSQFAAMLSENISSYEMVMKRIGRLEKQLKNPYFARIDFKFEDETAVERFYIGRFSLEDESEIIVCDWRSPFAGMFYRYGLGSASYDAPAGKIYGEISLKRQYEIQNGTLVYFFDADIEILDEFLRKMLSQNASPQMKSVVETIQRDQDVVIRDLENDLLIVQGAAGSGKTSIALHRAAYLMYSGLANKLASDCIAVISPHAVFKRYISNVLPELGEENVQSFLIDEILSMILRGSKIQTKVQLTEMMISRRDPRISVIKRSLAFKTSGAFAQMLKTLDLAGHKLSDVFSAYKNMFYDKDCFFQLAQGIPMPDNIEEIILFTRQNLQSPRLFFDDASALAYLYLTVNGYDEYTNMKHVVIDEAQDYYPIHFEIFKMLFPNARYTILGDIAQTIEKEESPAFYEEIRKLFDRKKSSIFTLTKSFRCTGEILQFAAKFIDSEIRHLGRSGEEPEIYALAAKDELETIIQEIRLCMHAGYNSIGIICKSAGDCSELFSRLLKVINVSLIKSASDALPSGVFILPVYLSKGLEFDAVLIWDADKEHYSTESDKKLLYIGCTRALHRLSLFYYDSLSPFIVP